MSYLAFSTSFRAVPEATGNEQLELEPERDSRQGEKHDDEPTHERIHAAAAGSHSSCPCIEYEEELRVPQDQGKESQSDRPEADEPVTEQAQSKSQTETEAETKAAAAAAAAASPPPRRRLPPRRRSSVRFMQNVSVRCLKQSEEEEQAKSDLFYSRQDIQSFKEMKQREDTQEQERLQRERKEAKRRARRERKQRLAERRANRERELLGVHQVEQAEAEVNLGMDQENLKQLNKRHSNADLLGAFLNKSKNKSHQHKSSIEQAEESRDAFSVC